MPGMAGRATAGQPPHEIFAADVDVAFRTPLWPSLGHRHVRHQSNIRPIRCGVDPARAVNLGTVGGCATEHYCRVAPLRRCCPSWRTGCSGHCSRPRPPGRSPGTDRRPLPRHHPHRLQQRLRRPRRRYPAPAVRVADHAGNPSVRAGRRSPGPDPVPAGHLTVARAAARAIAAARPRGTCPHCAGTADEMNTSVRSRNLTGTRPIRIRRPERSCAAEGSPEQQFNNGQPFPDRGANNHRGRGIA